MNLFGTTDCDSSNGEVTFDATSGVLASAVVTSPWFAYYALTITCTGTTWNLQGIFPLLVGASINLSGSNGVCVSTTVVRRPLGVTATCGAVTSNAVGKHLRAINSGIVTNTDSEGQSEIASAIASANENAAHLHVVTAFAHRVNGVKQQNALHAVSADSAVSHEVGSGVSNSNGSGDVGVKSSGLALLKRLLAHMNIHMIRA